MSGEKARICASSRVARDTILSVNTSDIADAIRTELLPLADPDRAPGQQAYMKSALPFLGIPVPQVRKVAKSHIRGMRDGDALRAAANDLWRNATHREHWYAAMTILGSRACRSEESLPLIEHMIRTGEWWDVTDELAHRFADLQDDGSEHTRVLLYEWTTDENLWIRRVSIISQLLRRERYDRDLLTTAILENAEDRDFFIRKAIGWALREVGKTDPDWVRGFVAQHELSPLSRKEALKHLG